MSRSALRGSCSRKSWQKLSIEDCYSDCASRVHRFLKGPVPWTSFDIEIGDGGPPRHADSRASKWHEAWRVSGVKPVVKWPRAVDIPMQSRSDDVGELRRASATFKKRTAIGAHWLHPRQFSLLSDGILLLLLWVCRMMLALGCIPKQLD